MGTQRPTNDSEVSIFDLDTKATLDSSAIWQSEADDEESAAWEEVHIARQLSTIQDHDSWVEVDLPTLDASTPYPVLDVDMHLAMLGSFEPALAHPVEAPPQSIDDGREDVSHMYDVDMSTDAGDSHVRIERVDRDRHEIARLCYLPARQEQERPEQRNVQSSSSRRYRMEQSGSIGLPANPNRKHIRSKALPQPTHDRLMRDEIQRQIILESCTRAQGEMLRSSSRVMMTTSPTTDLLAWFQAFLQRVMSRAKKD